MADARYLKALERIRIATAKYGFLISIEAKTTRRLKAALNLRDRLRRLLNEALGDIKVVEAIEARIKEINEHITLYQEL